MEFIFEVPAVSCVLPIAQPGEHIFLTEENPNIAGNDIPPPKPK